jgi:tetratricopeptide (TPR) repeat protein
VRGSLFSAQMRFCVISAASALVVQACAGPRPVAVSPFSTVVMAQTRIVTPSEITTEGELAARAERALMEQRWHNAADAYRTLLAADSESPHAAQYLFDLGLALEGLQDRTRARDAFLDLVRRFPNGPHARGALVRVATLDAYLEDWQALQFIGDQLLVRTDLDDVERIVALGARALASVECGNDAAASRDINDGLDLADQLHYGDRDVLPVAVAQVRFALGELRRVRSERIRFDPVPVDFLAQLDARCQGLLQAQAAYAQAVRSVDPHWAAMAGYRLGAMYRLLHHDLMQIPPPSSTRTPGQRQAFFAFMHVRYRVLLEKGLREIDQTIALGERTRDSSTWILRAREAKEEMQNALTEERARLQQMPFTEADVKAALDLLQKNARASGSASRATPAPHAAPP